MLQLKAASRSAQKCNSGDLKHIYQIFTRSFGARYNFLRWPLTMIVLVSLERDSGQIVDELIRKLRAAQEVIDMWYVTGDHDLVLHVAAQNMANYDVFTRRTLHADDHVRSFKTLVVLQQPQRAAPLPPPACSS